MVLDTEATTDSPCASALQRAKTCAVFTVGGIGDHLFALPFLHALRTSYPDLHITQVSTQPKAAELSLSAGLVDRVSVIRSPMGLAGERVRGFGLGTRWARFAIDTIALRRRRFGASIFLATGLTPRLAAWQAAVHARIRIASGERSPPTLRYLHFVVPEDQTHHIDRNLRLAKLLGCDVRGALDCYKDIFGSDVTPVVPANAIIIHPFLASPVVDGRCWPLEKFAAVYRELCEAGHRPTVVGTAEELRTPALQLWPHLRTRELGSLKESAALLSGARLVIGNDSAVVHLASILGVQVITVVGSSDPTYTRPYFGGAVVRLELPCSPCFSHRGYERCTHFSCVRALSPSAVLEHPELQALFPPRPDRR